MPAGLSALKQHHGKQLSYNNLLDLDGALLSLSPFAHSPRAAVCIIKHTTPCGLGISDSLSDAYEKAFATDPTSAFGSVIAMNGFLDEATAELMSKLFIECIVAPGYSQAAMAKLTEKKDVRLLTFPEIEGGDGDDNFLAAWGRVPEARMLRTVYGGMLVQTPPCAPLLRSRRRDLDRRYRAASDRRRDGRPALRLGRDFRREVETRSCSPRTEPC